VRSKKREFGVLRLCRALGVSERASTPGAALALAPGLAKRAPTDTVVEIEAEVPSTWLLSAPQSTPSNGLSVGVEKSLMVAFMPNGVRRAARAADAGSRAPLGPRGARRARDDHRVAAAALML
jgi:hypothetical protein